MIAFSMHFLEIISALAVGGILIGVHLMEKRHLKNRDLTESELLFILARYFDTSEFKLFCSAASSWNISVHQVEIDFKHYLLNNHIPTYVRDFLRKIQTRLPSSLFLHYKKDPLIIGPGPASNSP